MLGEIGGVRAEPALLRRVQAGVFPREFPDLSGQHGADAVGQQGAFLGTPLGGGRTHVQVIVPRVLSLAGVAMLAGKADPGGVDLEDGPPRVQNHDRGGQGVQRGLQELR